MIKDRLELAKHLRDSLPGPEGDWGPAYLHIKKHAEQLVVALSSSCACGGREPIWDGCAYVHTVAGHKAYADPGSIILRGADVKEGQSLEILVFGALPTEEGT